MKERKKERKKKERKKEKKKKRKKCIANICPKIKAAVAVGKKAIKNFFQN